MESLITFLISNKIVLIIAVIISVLIVLSVAKKLLKVALFFLALMVLYAAYLVYTGQKVPRTKQEAIQHVIVKFDEMKVGGQKKAGGRR